MQMENIREPLRPKILRERKAVDQPLSQAISPIAIPTHSRTASPSAQAPTASQNGRAYPILPPIIKQESAIV